MPTPRPTQCPIQIDSEIGRLRKVIVHSPGPEIENVTPASAAEALYDDILYLPLAQEEHRHFTAVLETVAQVFELTELLETVLADPGVAEALLGRLCELYHCQDRLPELLQIPPAILAHQLIEGTPMRKDSLTKFLSPLRFDLPPLPNAFFMRDATMCVNDRVVIGSMANRVREAEALLLRAIFSHHPEFRESPFYFDGTDRSAPNVTIEGGDLLVIRPDLVVLGFGERTSPQAIDVLLQAFAQAGRIRDVIVVEIPRSRATIHLDMIFTMIDVDKCVVFPPLITGEQKCRAIHVAFEEGRIRSLESRPDLLTALAELGVRLEPIPCGGQNPLYQEREQWTSGANFFAIAPGKIIGYERNPATFAELERHGYPTIQARDVMAGRVDLADYPRCAIMMPGAELSRGGGGCRCMTLPVWREPVAL